MYIYDALVSVAPILRAFSKATKPSEYPKEPYAITVEAKEAKEEREKEKARQEAKATLTGWASKVNKKMESKNGQS